MAAPSASRSWAAFARRAVTTSAVAGLGLLALAIPASAHTPKATPVCDEGAHPMSSVHVVLKDYKLNPDDAKNKTPNSVEVFEVVAGKDVLIKKVDFATDLDETFGHLDGRKEHTFKVIVKAWDDKVFDDKEGFSRTIDDLKTKVCDTSQPPVENPPPAQPPANNPPAPQPAAAPAAAPSTELASTGVSIAVPLAIGGVLLVGGAGLLLLMRRRSKA